MKVLLVASVLGLTLCGCVPRGAEIGYPAGVILPFEAIQRAAYAAPKRVFGLFWLRVQAVGSLNGEVFLNSEKDYRDQRNITIVLRPDAAKSLQRSLREPLTEAFMHKSVLVRGAAQRVTIHFAIEGKPSTKYYYQTHVDVVDPDQIAFAAKRLPVP